MMWYEFSLDKDGYFSFLHAIMQLSQVGGIEMPNHTFEENVVVITGASSGIGREMALQLSDQGAW